MFIVLRLFFLWPVVCLLSALIVSPFNATSSLLLWVYFYWLSALSLGCFYYLSQALTASLKAIRQTPSNRQGWVSLAMIALFLMTLFPFGLVIALVGFGSFG